MKHIITLILVLAASGSFAQHSKKHLPVSQYSLVVNQLLQRNEQHNDAAMKTTASTIMQRVIAQSTRDNTLASLSDSVRTRYTAKRGSTYDYNTMIFPYNYPYSTTPMFNFAGTFTTPQVQYDTYVHWTINPFAMPAFGLYEGWFATYDTNNCLTTFKKLFVDSATNNDNVSYVNAFNTAKKIDVGLTFNLNAGVADSAFKQYFTYDTANRLTKDSVYELHLGVWRIAAKTNYTYVSGNLTQIDHFANETDTSFLLPLAQQSKYVNTYDASNRLTTVLTSLSNGTALIAYIKDTFGYSGTYAFHNSWKQHQFDPIHGTWWPQYYMSKHLTTAGKPDTIYHKGWDSIANAWTPISRDIMTYNSYNNPDKKQNYEYNWTSYSTAPDYTTTYYYDTFSVPVAPTATTVMQEQAIHIFPNPATNNLTLAMPGGYDNQLITLSLFNVNGQVVSRQSIRSQPQSEIPVNFLAPGMYWMIVQDKNGVAVSRQQFVKQ